MSMSAYPHPTFPVIVFGPNANCTLEICPIQWSVYKYRPSIPANGVFLALFALALLVHVLLGFRWRSWSFMGFMIVGCLLEIIGYAGRILLHGDPWSFGAFMIQIVFITCGPVFYTAAIYITLSKVINFLGPKLSRMRPELFYYIFIPLDLVCLVLQAAGGALSTISSGKSQTGVNVALAGLGLQVASLVIFAALFADYLIRFLTSKGRQSSASTLDKRMRLFLAFLSAAVVLILLRCIYRCYELSKGYVGSNLITNEGLFMGLEGVPIILAVFCLCVGHPGLIFSHETAMAAQPAVPASDTEYSDESGMYRSPVEKQ